MIPARSGVTLDVRNRQRAFKVNLAQLRQLAGQILLDCRARMPTGIRAVASRTTAGNPTGVPALQNLSLVLVSDPTMARLNRQYHDTAGTTDVLSFDYGAGHGELIISVPRAVAQARQFRTTPSRELALYIVHGILHLQGYDDRTPGPRRRMRAAERRWLRKLDFRGLLPVRYPQRTASLLGVLRKNSLTESDYKRHLREKY